MKKNKKIKINFLNFVCSFFPIRNSIIFESNPDMSCNSFMVYKKMIELGLNKKFKLIWRVNDCKKFNDLKKENTFFIEKFPKNFFRRIKNYFIINRAKVNISCVTPVSKENCNKKQLNIYLDHGSPLKEMTKNGEPLFKVDSDYFISQAPFFNKYIMKSYGILEKSIRVLGIPRNDQFFSNVNKIVDLYDDFSNFKKIIAWVPTFRVTSKNRIDCSFEHKLGIPVVKTLNELKELNDFLKANKTLLIIKPHPASNTEIIRLSNLSNIRILHNDKMLKCGVHTNEFLKCTDAMITDYSGIYYDYLLLNKPIGITLDDFEIYNKEHGFIIEKPLEILRGFEIYSVDDLKKFILDVSHNIDLFLEERQKINNLSNFYKDGLSTERVTNFIVNEMKKRRLIR